MRNRLWILSAGIVLLNFALVLFLRRGLPEVLPFHISPDGSFAETMPYARLFWYPVVSLGIVVALYLLAAALFKRFPALDDPRGIRYTLVTVAAVCLPLVILSSTCVSLSFAGALTRAGGAGHIAMGPTCFFMFAEPVIVLLLITALIVGALRIKKC